ncbi:MAG: UPF0175 family protein [Phaeodactylibacter sp.]|nr:UPF0175 family protein [Phaeodactylibacter sp.]
MEDLLIKKETLEKAEMSGEELLIELAVYLYDKERMSLGQARNLVGMDVLSFQRELSKRDVYIKYDVEDLEEDLKTLKKLRDKKAS